MNISRRKLLFGAPVVAAGAVALAVIPVPTEPTRWSSFWNAPLKRTWQTSFKRTVRTGLPAPTWRKMYEGVQPNKGTRA